MTAKVPFAMLLCCAAALAMTAEDTESLEEDFLAYLAEFEGDDDDWTIVEVAAATAPAKPANDAAAKASTTPPVKTPAPKAATPADGSKR
jgi:hypothetical protein